MKVHFWGVRGSIPAPLKPQDIRNKISAVLQTITHSDIETPDAKEKFLASLPPDVFGTIGGNTACVELSFPEDSSFDNTYFLFDAGTGLREFATSEYQKANAHKRNLYHIFFSHFHWDHIQGLPFFTLGYNPNNEIHFYSTCENFETYLTEQMKNPYFPVPLVGTKGFGAKLFFHVVKMDSPFEIGQLKVSCKEVNHPGGCTSYKIQYKDKSFIYSTDTELLSENFFDTQENIDFYKSADTIVIDAQYTMMESIEKVSWGHSAITIAAEFATKWNIKKTFLFHHEPMYSDRQLYKFLQIAKWYVQYVHNSDSEILLATEGEEFDV